MTAMKVICRIPGLNRQVVGDGLFSRLIVAYPVGHGGLTNNPEWFRIELPEDDPRMREVIHLLERAGWRQWVDYSRPPTKDREYDALWFRKYSTKDWNESKYLVPFARSWTMIHNLRDGRVGHETNETNHKSDAVADKAGHRGLLVPDRVKRELDRAGLIGLRFEEAVPLVSKPGVGYVPRPKPPKRLGDWWVLSSEIRLPPMSPSCDLRSVPDIPLRGGGEPPFARKPDDPPYACLEEGLFVYPEAHYGASDLQTMPPFDAALSHETFGSTMTGPSRMLIVSNRFYKVCRALDYRVSWIPVRIDEA